MAAMDEFLRYYLEAAIWAAPETEDGQRLDRFLTPDDIINDPEVQEQADRISAWVDAHGDLICEALDEGFTEEEVAVDLLLTADGHGAGFWDGRYPADLGKRLTEAADELGPFEASCLILPFATLDGMLASEDWQHWHEEWLSPGGCGLILEDPDRYSRILEAAADGADGSTHAEVISDWCRFVDSCRDWLPEAVLDAIDEEIDQCIAWHLENGSLEEVIG